MDKYKWMTLYNIVLVIGTIVLFLVTKSAWSFILLMFIKTYKESND